MAEVGGIGRQGAVGPLSFVMSEESKQRLLALLVLQTVRDPRILAACSCVSRAWREYATDEELWRKICESEWPSLKSSVGRKLVLRRGYYSFFTRRMNLDVHRAPFAPPPKLGLHLRDLVFFMDVVYKKSNIFSMVVEGQDLAGVPSTFSNVSNEDLFRFSAPYAEDKEAVIVPSSVDAPRMWTEAQICSFEVTWSVMEKKTLKSIKLVQTKRGRMVGSSCLFESCLPFLSCFCSVSLYDSAVPTACPIAAEVAIQFCEREPGLLSWRGVTMGTLLTHALRYQAKDQALVYLEYHFSRSESFCHYDVHRGLHRELQILKTRS
ncbi:hypothetical protein Mapa_011470 [Marchantia paleacea]|nr:hypothetical protein Mapa_011470 [Marchantia paleacea]